ncbi:hypothetical protein TRP66_04500 [Pseudomonas sp. JDS28PS106]|uniref:hypothetical protein n=1 Tax=Pseudomonas sp. JDS28PS106 TaxID=2497235 RepID=UPI002FD23D3F
MLAICRSAAVKPVDAVFQVNRVIVYRQQAGSYKIRGGRPFLAGKEKPGRSRVFLVKRANYLA